MELRQALVSTNQFARWAGSEVVATEFVEALLERGLNVTLFTNLMLDELASPLRDKGVTVTDQAHTVDLWGQDVVFAQHAAFGRLLSTPAPANRSFPVFVFNHLSPYAPLEVPGPHFEAAFADIILANSPETRAAIAEHGVVFEEKTEVFPNPAPNAFARPERAPNETLKRIMCVSNHVPTEMRKALRLLERRGVKVDRIGRRDTRRRIVPSDFDTCDGVVTIGKTAQYAMAARVPVFCYDRFGGPGWLRAENFRAAADTNFSGRCVRNPRQPEALADEICAGFAKADQFAVSMPASDRAEFLLDPLFDALLARVRTLKGNDARAEQALAKVTSGPWATLLDEERQASEAARSAFLAKWEIEKDVDRRRQRRQSIRRFFGIQR